MNDLLGVLGSALILIGFCTLLVLVDRAERRWWGKKR